MKIDLKTPLVSLFCLTFLFLGSACSTAYLPKDAPSIPTDTPVSTPSDEQTNTTPVPDGEHEGETVPPPTPETKEPERYIQIKTDGLNVRKKATTSSAVLGRVDKGTNMLFLGKENGFYKTYYQGKEGFVSAKTSHSSTFTLPPSSDERVEKVLLEGYKRIGVPYVYGATRLHDGKGNFYKGFTVSKFDCSSLTQYMFYHGAGILLDVNTRTQIYQGTPVKKKDIARGDVLFFTNSTRYDKKGIERVGHVAVYLGDNLILHTASDYCKIEEISAVRWGYYLEAKRML